MFEYQPNEVVAAVLWGLESSVYRALPREALVSSARAYCDGYSVATKWLILTVRGNRQECTLAVHFSLIGAKVYCRPNHPRREEICRRVSEWLCVQLEFQRAGLCVDTGYGLVLTASNALFLDERDTIQVGCENREHDLSLYRGVSLPPLRWMEILPDSGWVLPFPLLDSLHAGPSCAVDARGYVAAIFEWRPVNVGTRKCGGFIREWVSEAGRTCLRELQDALTKTLPRRAVLRLEGDESDGIGAYT